MSPPLSEAPNAVAPFDGKNFRNALGRFATGVTIVTTLDSRGVDVGLTASSFNSVSMEPPLVLWSLDQSSANLPAFSANPHFVVHVLSVAQRPLAERFALRGADKFAGLTLTRGIGGLPLIPGCCARFQCSVVHRYAGGDHLILVGEVMALDEAALAPLVYQAGAYVRVEDVEGPRS